ncbi:MAG: AraC family transcriptional regulator [Acidobacteria bacterium]|nr:AraC family transcriptional regulator [Acidobacteriota bacterium]MCL5287674.1 AraC family transcriptional regulator [Acidobacteriota bacterium]
MSAETRDSYQERILRVLVHIQQHLDEPLPLEELAGVANFSRFHFHRIFHGMVGESVKEHVRRLRLERAALRLKSTREPIVQIALAAGYDAHESFTRAFRVVFGENPSEYRDSRRAMEWPAAPSNVHFSAEGSMRSFVPYEWIGKRMEAQIRPFTARRVAFARHVGPYHKAGDAWDRLMTWAGPRGLLGAQFMLLGIVHDDPETTPPDKWRYDAAIGVGENVQGERDIGIQEIPEGRYAVALHHGEYSTLGQSYARLCSEWLPQSGQELAAAPALEIYLNSPKTTKPEDLLTEIWLPIVA